MGSGGKPNLKMGPVLAAALFASGAAATLACLHGGNATAAEAPMTWAQLLSRPKPQPTRTVAYGAAPQQVADLWLPSGAGPFPTVVMIHGGCWQASITDRHYMNYAADDLRRRGIAVWNIEYRAIDQPGGGYPGTFKDVGAAIDRLAIEAPPADIPNLKTDTETACGAQVLHKLTGAPSAARPDVYADTSPAALLPLGMPQVVIHGAQDVTVPPAIGMAYVKAARAAGDQVVFHSPPGGHVEEVTPGQPAWEDAVAAVQTLMREAPAR